MDRPRRSTRNSLASSSGGTPGTPSNTNNPYKKPTYLSNARGNGGDTPTSNKNTNGTPASSGGTRGRRGRGRPPGRSSMPGGRGAAHQSHSYQHTKPECIAVRVDGRRSTGGSTASSAGGGGGRRGAATGGGRRSTYSSRHDYEYHYGSDFESDQNESEPEEDDIESEEQEESESESVSVAGADNENAESDSDYSVSSSRVTSSRLPSPPVPFWLDAEKVPDIPPLELPSSSDDLLLSKDHVVKAVEIYEPLRRFHQLVRLSPFRFEDFCAALACEDQSSLLAEMHIQLLKCVIREEDSNGTIFGPNEVKDSVQAIVYFVDHITWPETIRSYLESDPAWKDVYEAMISVEYPFCGPAVRIKVLGWLVDQFLTTNVVREQLLGDGNILHEDHCRACNRLGELICCESCPAVYHIECLSPPLKDPDNPPDMWKCPVCAKHQIPGVNDCTSEVEKMGLLIRHERLGYDRHGRKYWFLVRRLLVESEDGSEVWYYSTRGLVEDLITRLDATEYETTLISNIKSVEDEIYRHMDVTEEVTRLQNTQRRKTYLDIENGKDSEGDGPERVTRLKSTGLYKLGQENLFKTYVNHFISDPLATSKGKHNEERDRKRHMSHKFSLTTASECKYGIKDLTGCSRQTQISALRGALSHMETVVPTTLMHVNWPMLRKTWLTTIQTGTCALDFSRAMIMISACIRNTVYNPVWSESAGLVRFSRMTLMEREERKKSEKRDKKDKDDEEDRLKAVPQYTKNPLPIRHQVYKQKGEEYRVHGRWGWIWLSNLRRCKSQDCREQGLLAGPHKHVIQVKNETGKVKTMLIDPGVYSKLMAKRNLAVTSAANTSTPTTSSDSANVKPLVSSSSAPPSADTPVVSSDSQNSQSSSTTTGGGGEEKNTEQNPPVVPVTEDCSSSSSNKENGNCDVEIKDNAKEDEQAKASPPPIQEVMKVEEEEEEGEDKSSTKSVSDLKNDIEIVEDGESKKTIDTTSLNSSTDIQKHLEPKEEPMEVIEGGHEDKMEDVETNNQDKPLVNGEVLPKDMEVDGEREVKKQIGDEKDNEVVIKENAAEETSEKKDVIMEVDKSMKEKMEESQDVLTKENPVESCEAKTEAKSSLEEETKESTTNSLEDMPTSEESQNGTTTTAPTLAPPTPLSADKQAAAAADDSQGRKFKTDLVNVSSGLASAHRILYPKIARRSEYLDSLLHRRLTLMSLEDKQLKSTYSEDMVAKAKPGLTQFEEEEKRRDQEKEEYPGEEVVDENLTLGGAYAFCCYSSECRKEAKDFMKVKGKNRERTYEKICYSPMCRLKFCLQETTRLKQERMREIEKERFYKVYKEIEEKRQYTLEGTSHKVYMKKLPECLTVTPSTPAAGGIGGSGAGSHLHSSKKKPKTQAIKYPQISSFRYASSKKPSILMLPGFELKRLARTAGRQFTPAGFFQNQKSGSWGWSLPCGRPVFRTAWQYKTTHANSLATAAMQLRILYASIRWDDILAKIPNSDGRHQVHTDTEIITTEILNHRIVGRFMERVQYRRRMQVVPIDAPKTIREITPSRIGLRKRKRAESPDKTEPVVTEDWVDEEKLELWEIRFYGDRIDRKHTTGGIGRFSDSNTPSTRTKSGIAIKQPEKYDPSHNPTPTGERKTYGNAATHHNQQHAGNPVQASISSSSGSSASSSSSMSDTVDSTIEQVIRNHDPTRVAETKLGGDGKSVSAVKTAELMRETIETEMKMQRAVHLSKRDSHAKHNTSGGPNNGTKQSGGVPPLIQPTASQQFQMQQNNAKVVTPVTTTAAPRNTGVIGTPTSSKVGGVVVGKKFFANRQSTGATTSTDAGILTKRPLQSTITINKGAGGSIQVFKNNPIAPPVTTGPAPQQQQIPQQSAPVAVPTTVAVATLGGQQMVNMAGGVQSQVPPTAAPLQPQKFTVIRLPDGRLQVKGLLPGQHCYQTSDGKIHVTVSAAQVQQIQMQQQAIKQQVVHPGQTAIVNATLPTATTQPTPNTIGQGPAGVVTTSTAPANSGGMPVITSSSSMANVASGPAAQQTTTSDQVPIPGVAVNTTTMSQSVLNPQPAGVITTSASGVIQVQQQGTQQQVVVVSSQQNQQQPLINISSQSVKSNISNTTNLVASTSSGAINKPTITVQQQQPQQQIIVQQNGQQFVIHGAAAQALLQQKLQQQQQQQQRTIVTQTSIPSQTQQVIKQITTSAGGQYSLKSPMVVQTSGATLNSSTPTNQITGRIVIQDGKAVLIGSPAGLSATTAQQQQRNVIVNNKQVIQTSSAAQQQQTIVRPQIIQTSAGGQIIQGGTAMQLIQSGQGLQLITQQATPQQIVTSTSAVTIPSNTGAEGTCAQPTSSSLSTLAQTITAMSTTSSVVSTSPSKTNVIVSSTPTSAATTMTTAVKHVLPDGRTVLLSPTQLGDFTGAGRKVVIANKQVVQFPTSSAGASTTTGMRPTTQQQLLQSLMGSGATTGTIQILQGPGGQQYLIQQPATQQTTQQQQHQVQIVVPSGQLGGSPLLVKKFVKPTSATGTSPTVLNKPTGNVVQIAATAQNQLSQLLGPNKTLVRLDNNQLAAIQLSAPQTQQQQVQTATGTSVSVASSVVANKAPAQTVQQTTTALSTPVVTPTTTPQQQQTTITRTPGLPISIVSPSKSKVQQQQQSPKTQVSSPTTAASGTTTPTTTNPKGSPTVIKVSSPLVVRVPTPTIVPIAATQPTTPQKAMTPVKNSTTTTPVIATKSAPPPIQVTNTPTGSVIISAQPPQISTPPGTAVVQQSSKSATLSSPVITAIKSQPPPITQDSTPTIAVKSLPHSVPASNIVPQTPLTTTTSQPVAVKSAPPPIQLANPSPSPVVQASGSTPSGTQPSTPKAKAPPSKIVAQIFHTPQGPKVVIQGVNPGELTQNQMMQLQAQIQKQLAAQQQQQQQSQQQKPVVVATGPANRNPGSATTPAVMPPASSAVVQQQQQPSIMTQPHQATSSLPTILQKHQPSSSSVTASALAAQHHSPIEVLRSGSSSSVPVSQSPLTSPIMSRSPPPPTMVSTAKILSPPANLPTLLSPHKSVVGRQDMVAAVSSVREPSVPGSPTILSSPGQPVVVARKSQPRKSPIRPNNLDSPPPPPMMSPPPPPLPVVHNNVNSVAMELMRPLNSEQQQLLTDRRNALKEDIMEKKKAAATLMRLEAQREIQEKLEKQKASVELAKAEEQKRVGAQQQQQQHNPPANDARAAKKRKMDNSVVENRNSRNSSSDEAPPSKPATNNAKGPRGRGRGKKGKRKLFCVCKTPYNKDRFYVGCDKCDNWFHGDCIGITEEMSKDLPEYICDDCRDDKLYCMCKQPYNESQFYIQCDKCEDWFHGRCVGVLQGESDRIGDYSCPQCEPQSEINFPNGKKLDASDYGVVGRLLKELLTNRSSQPFRKPVTKAQAPNYFSIIKEPMDLQTISIRLDEKQYERLREFIGDVGKIFENCRYYNDSTTDIFRQGDTLEKLFVQKVWALRQTLNTRLHQVIP